MIPGTIKRLICRVRSLLLAKLERFCLYCGAALVALTTAVWIAGFTSGRSALAKFDELQARLASDQRQAALPAPGTARFHDTLLAEAGSTLGVLLIQSVGIEVPVFDSTSRIALNRGSGYVDGTALPGTAGNVAIAGHRDTFFRGLKDIQIGASVRLTTLNGFQEFRVSEINVVDPLDVGVLKSTDETVLTLITCYPFFFVGPAPERFVVRATLLDGSSDLESRIQTVSLTRQSQETQHDPL